MSTRILQVNSPSEIKRIMREIKVDPCGIEIMLPKAVDYLVKIKSLPSIEANILKQEMLSLGGDVAVSRDTLTGKVKKTDCLLIGNLSQYSRLNKKLIQQPFGLNKLSIELSQAIANYQNDSFLLDLGRFKLKIEPSRCLVWGVVNLTCDSFSGDGLCKPQTASRMPQVGRVIEIVEKMIDDGADIIDIGGESTRPNATPVSAKEELSRVIPAIKKLAKKIKVPISIDTYKPEVALQALDNGACIVNDITALGRGALMAKAVKKHQGAIVLMHMKGKPVNMQKKPRYNSLLDEIIGFLRDRIERAEELGIDKNKIIVDPGIGFGKTAEHNLEILKNLKELKILGQPLLVGPSRKSFIGKILNAAPQERSAGTISACVLASRNGANFVRVHDVKAVKQALKLAEAVNNIC